MAVFWLPVVLLTSAPVPRVVLLCAAAIAARDNEKMSAAITTKKNETVFVEWLNICKLSFKLFFECSATTRQVSS
jgi:hypothetical protein